MRTADLLAENERLRDENERLEAELAEEQAARISLANRLRAIEHAARRSRLAVRGMAA